MKRTHLIALLLTLPTLAAAETTVYLQGGIGYQIGMTERWEYESEHYRRESTMDLPPVVGTVEAGVSYRNWFIQAQHVSSVETGQDHGFNVISTGYRWELEF